MASPTYTAQAIVLKKTKLGESDLILTLLSDTGAKIKAVAKGARKPKSQFASRLELYNEVDLLCSVGKSLDIIKEVRAIRIHEKLHTDYVYSLAASCIVEYVDRVTHVGLEYENLFAMTSKALTVLADTREEMLSFIVSAYLFKAFAMTGIRPALNRCSLCGDEIDYGASQDMVRFSYIEGGVVCSTCHVEAQTQYVDKNTVLWMNALISSTFEEIIEFDIGSYHGSDLLQICQQWCICHIGRPLNSLKQFMYLAIP